MMKIIKIGELKKYNLYDYFCCEEKFCLCSDKEINGLIKINKELGYKFNEKEYCYDYYLVDVEFEYQNERFQIEFSIREKDVKNYVRLLRVFDITTWEDKLKDLMIKDGFRKYYV